MAAKQLNDAFCTTRAIFKNLTVAQEETPETAGGKPIDLCRAAALCGRQNFTDSLLQFI